MASALGAVGSVGVHWGRSRGAQRITLRVLSHNTSARHLYEQCGFVTEGVLRSELLLDATYVDDVQMARNLTLSN